MRHLRVLLVDLLAFICLLLALMRAPESLYLPGTRVGTGEFSGRCDANAFQCGNGPIAIDGFQ